MTNETYILDTNLFFNMEAGLGMGEKAEPVIIAMTEAIRMAKKAGWQFWMPPRIMEEFLSFFEDLDQGFLQAFLAEIEVKAPDYGTMQLPAEVFALLISDIRARSYRGMDVAEEEMRKAGQLFMGKEHLDQKQFAMAIGPTIKKFRERYRNATRTGFLDSSADLDLIMLAKELNGVVVSADEGVVSWTRRFGVREMLPSVFGQRLRSVSA